MSSTPIADHRPILDDAIAEFVTKVAADEGGGMAIKWVIAIEYQDGEGKQYLLRFGNKDSSSWDRMGMMKFSMACEEASIEHEHEEDV